MLYKSSSYFKTEDVEGCHCSLRNSGRHFHKLLTHRGLGEPDEEDAAGGHSSSPWPRGSDRWCFGVEIFFVCSFMWNPQWTNLIIPAADLLSWASPSIPWDLLQSLLFMPPALTLFSFLASLQLWDLPLCPWTGKDPQFSKHICHCQAPPLLFSPTQASYSCSVFWLPSAYCCQLSLF